MRDTATPRRSWSATCSSVRPPSSSQGWGQRPSRSRPRPSCDCARGRFAMPVRRRTMLTRSTTILACWRTRPECSSRRPPAMARCSAAARLRQSTSCAAMASALVSLFSSPTTCSTSLRCPGTPARNPARTYAREWQPFRCSWYASQTILPTIDSSTCSTPTFATITCTRRPSACCEPTLPWARHVSGPIRWPWKRRSFLLRSQAGSRLTPWHATPSPPCRTWSGAWPTALVRPGPSLAWLRAQTDGSDCGVLCCLRQTATGANGLDRVKGQHQQRNPHDGEADPAAGTHGLAQEQNTTEQLQDRGDELQEADRHKWDPPGCGTEQDQWRGGRQAGRGQEQGMGRRVHRESGLAPQADPDENSDSYRHQYCSLGGQALQGAQRGAQPLLHQAVESEREGQAQRDPRRAPEVDREVDPGGEPDRYGHPLQPAESLAQDQDADRHGHDGVQEVAQGRLGYVVSHHRRYIDRPVDGQQHPGQGDCAEHPRVDEHRTAPAEIAADGKY